jgi:hypothetical protein
MGRQTFMGAVTIEGDVLRVGQRTVARRDVRAGFFDPGPPLQIVVTTVDDEIGIAMPDVETAKAGLVALGVDVEHRAVHFHRVSARTRRGWVILVFIAMLAVAGALVDLFKIMPLGVGVPWLLLTIYLCWRVGRAGMPIDIGADGVRVEGRFIPIADIRAVEASVHPCNLGHAGCFDAKVKLTTTEGEVLIPMTAGDAHAGERARVIAERIREAMGAEGPITPESSILDAPIDNIAEWREHVVKAATARADYRDDALDPHAMSEVLADPHAPLQRRLGAAIALHASGVDDAQQRIRICAEATVEPHFRFALERIADGAVNDELIERALTSAK